VICPLKLRQVVSFLQDSEHGPATFFLDITGPLENEDDVRATNVAKVTASNDAEKKSCPEKIATVPNIPYSRLSLMMIFPGGALCMLIDLENLMPGLSVLWLCPTDTDKKQIHSAKLWFRWV
jgi:hypothetical protein